MHPSSPKQAIQAINYLLHHKSYQQEQIHNYPTDLVGNSNRNASLLNTFSPLPVNHSFPPLTSHSHMPAPLPPGRVYASGGCYANNYGAYSPIAPHFTCPVPTTFPSSTVKANGYYYPNGFTGSSNYVCSIPTGQLIELEPTPVSYDTVDSSRSRLHADSYNNVSPDNSKAPVLNNVESDKDDGFETWDYVYRNLESQGYSKDMGERGDVLALAHDRTKNSTRKVKATNLDEVINNLDIKSRPLKINEALEKYKENERPLRKESSVRNEEISSSYENLSVTEDKKHSKSSLSKISAKSKLSVKDKLPSLTSSLSKLTQSKSQEAKRTKAFQEQEKNQVEGTASNKWECKACTFLNDQSKDICDMCSKSKVMVDQQMEIGGSQCPACTLVNPRSAKQCQACNESLKNSPTYI